MGVLDDAIREHLELKRQRGASDDEIASAESEALGPARRDSSLDDADDDGIGAGETVVIAPMSDPAPPPPSATRAVHDIDEDPMPPPAFLDRVERPEPDRSVLDQDTVEHPAPADQLPLGKDDEDDEDDGSGRVSE